MALPKPKRDYGRIIENVVVIVGLTVLVVLALNWLTGCTGSLFNLVPGTRSGLPDPNKIMASQEMPWWMWLVSFGTATVISMFGSHKIRKMDHRRQKKHKKGPYGECK